MPLNRLILLVATAFLTILASPVLACSHFGERTQQKETHTTEPVLTYSRRDNNRCEGFTGRRPVSGTLSLISFSSLNQDRLGQSLMIRVPGSDTPSSVFIQSRTRGYVVDEFALAPSSSHGHVFNLSTEILQAANIAINDLRGIARDRSGAIRYRPVIFGEGTPDSYEFVFYSTRRVQFLQAEIINQEGNVVKQWNQQAPIPGGEASFLWMFINTPPGQYTFSYKANISRRNQRDELLQGRIAFVHDPDWLRN